MRRAVLVAAWLAMLSVLPGCAIFQKELTIVPDNAEPVSVTASSLWEPEAAEDPILQYRLRLATEPTNAALHNNLGNLYVLKNWMDAAVSSYKKAIKINPDSAVVWNNLGTAYMKMKRDGDAMDALQKSVKIDKRYALGWYNLGVIYDQRGDYDNAIDHYLKAASFRPEILDVEFNPQVVNNRHLTV